MIPALLAPLLAKPAVAGVVGFARSWWKAAIGAVLVFPLAFGFGQCSGKSIQKDRAAAAAAIAVQGALTRDGAAKETAAGERLADEKAVTQLTEELTDAVAQTPDQTPDAVAVALGCQRLRNAGHDVSALPACGRP